MRAFLPLLLLTLGCRTAFSPPPPANSSPLTADDIRIAKRIVLISDNWGIHGGSHSQEYVFEGSGNCHCDSSHHDNGQWKGSPRLLEKKTYALPPESFQEVRRLLLDSKILKLHQGQHGIIFEGGRNFSIACDGHVHVVHAGGLPCEGLPEEYRALTDYLNGLLKREKESGAPP